MRKQSGGVAHLSFTPVVGQFTAFDGVIIAASTSPRAARLLARAVSGIPSVVNTSLCRSRT